ncbi:hypothetical protein GCM10022408_29410 [Hymenobacter fastidiosus]|uniref:Uncharacterized protein n=1 Tax=Hymenobacter fastidiosus TaxID=486264 RepID=A0ABP7SNZ1_9BACT
MNGGYVEAGRVGADGEAQRMFRFESHAMRRMKRGFFPQSWQKYFAPQLNGPAGLEPTGSGDGQNPKIPILR